MEELDHRLEASRAAMARLREGVEGGEPWPLSEVYGAEPESDWGPKEVLAHVAEMAPYWLGQIEAILAARSEPPPFGRVATDPGRIERIGKDRTLPAGELFDRIDRSLADVGARLRRLDETEEARRGLHTRLGEMTVGTIFERFIVGHVEDHVRQLEELLGSKSAARADPSG
jgi:alkanesulfonate monooxygenase SsuD/methylene tetrahydromethanopterin reductase-like flavin-dependent oxidoreductase (luciferase family)